MSAVVLEEAKRRYGWRDYGGPACSYDFAGSVYSISETEIAALDGIWLDLIPWFLAARACGQEVVSPPDGISEEARHILEYSLRHGFFPEYVVPYLGLRMELGI